jgi:hypothetical protein
VCGTCFAKVLQHIRGGVLHPHIPGYPDPPIRCAEYGQSPAGP